MTAAASVVNLAILKLVLPTFNVQLMLARNLDILNICTRIKNLTSLSVEG